MRVRIVRAMAFAGLLPVAPERRDVTCPVLRARATGDVGFYHNTAPQRPGAPLGPDPHQTLRRLADTALVVKASCDYLPWSTATDYRDTLPNARMVYLPGAGHAAYAERPDAFFSTVNAFLTEQPLPLPAETRTQPPPDYQGTA